MPSRTRQDGKIMTKHPRLRYWLYWLMVSLVSQLSAVAASLSITHLSCEYLTNPLGIDALRPRLSWIVESTQRAQTQSAYQILVASSKNNLKSNHGDLWDSGKVASDQTLHLPYAGKSLRSGQSC